MTTPVYFKEQVSKYKIPLDHLDFGYINKCNNVKELEKIYKLLKSGEEGTYVDLEKCCEDKLKKLNPNSRALRKATALLNLSDINKEERKDLEDDLQDWTANMASLDDNLKNMTSKTLDSQNEAPIRCPEKNAESQKKEKKKPPPVSKKPVMPRGYKDWDKFDIEKELKSADEVKETKKKPQNTNPNLSETVNVNPDTLEDTKQTMAAREKDKGNEAFKSGDYNEAVIYYNRSLSICTSDVAYNNRALVYLKLNRWDDAIRDCNKVIENEKDNIKALLRRATAYTEKGEHNKALCDLRQVLVLEPENQRAKQILEKVQEKCPASTQNGIETETVPKKKKGRKMVIEDVDGTEEEEFAKLKDHSASLSNGLPEKADEIKSKEKSDEVPKEVSPSETTKGKGDGQSGKASKQKKNIKNKQDAKSSMSGDNSLNTQDNSPASNAKQGEASGGDSPAPTGQTTDSENPEGKKDSQESASVSCDKNSKTEETLKKTPTIFTHYPLPSKVEAIKLSGNDMFQRGRYAEAVKFYTDAIDMLQEKSDEQTVNLSLIYSNRAACCLKMGNCQGSIADCTASLDLVPHGIKPLLRRAAAYETLERYGLAYIDYKHVLAIDFSVEVAQQGSSRCSQTLIQLQGYSWREKLPPLVTVQTIDIPIIEKPPGTETPENAKSVENENSSQKSEKKLEKQSSTAEKQGSTPEKKAPKTVSKDDEFDKLKAQGNQHVKNEEYLKAIECYTKCAQLFPEKVVSYTNRALCYLKLNQANKAETDCDESLKKEPGNIKAMFRRAQAKKLKQHYRESISDLKNLLTMDPKNSAAKKELEVVKNYWRQELNAMKASMGDGKSKTDSNKCKQEGDSGKPAPSGSGNGSGKKGSKQRTRVHVHDVDEENNNSTNSSNSQNKSTPVPPTKSHGKHHKNSAPKKSEGNNQQNQAANNNKKGCKSGGRTAPPPPVAAPHIDKATPYEFLKAWNSLKTVRNTKPYADLLAQVPPENLPKMISNKLDAAMLNLITRCVSEHYADKGTADLGLQILSNVTKVERFQTIAMFMSSKEKSDLLSLLETLAAHQTLYGEEEMQKLKHEYGLK